MENVGIDLDRKYLKKKFPRLNDQTALNLQNNQIELKMSKFLCYMKGKHLQYFYESDDCLFARLRNKLQQETKMKDNDPFSRLVLSYMRNHSSECLFLMHKELYENIFSKF